MAADLRTDTSHALHGRTEVEAGIFAALNTESPGGADIEYGPRCPDDSLGGDTAIVQAVSTHQVTLDECHPRPQSGGPGGADQTGCAGADHDQVVATGRCGIGPAFGMDLLLQCPVFCRIGLYAGRGVHGALTNFMAAEFMQ